MSNKIKQIALGTVDTTFYQFDPQLGFWGIPNIERDVTFPQCRDAVIRVRHNGEGNRDKPFVAAVPGEGILCTGGSHTWGGGVVQERRFSDVLENRTGMPVYNMGHVSMGLDQICLAIMTKSDFYMPAVHHGGAVSLGNPSHPEQLRCRLSHLIFIGANRTRALSHPAAK